MKRDSVSAVPGTALGNMITSYRKNAVRHFFGQKGEKNGRTKKRLL